MSDDMDFDPAVHATDKEGNPIVNRNGSFRKKRSDAGKKGGASAKSAAGSPRAKYREGVAGLMQIPCAVISLVDPVDGFCVAQHTAPISDALADLAVERPEFAAALDRVMAIGPYGALVGAVFGLGIQLAHNHGIVPEAMAKSMGATPKKEIERHLKGGVPQPAPEPEHAEGVPREWADAVPA